MITPNGTDSATDSATATPASITNTLKTSMSVTKTFANCANSTEIPSKATMQLQQSTDGSNWTDVLGETKELTDFSLTALSKSATFENLSKYDTTGTLIRYRAREISITYADGSVINADGVRGSVGPFVITYNDSEKVVTNTLKTVNITGTKTWVDTIGDISYKGIYRPTAANFAANLHLYDGTTKVTKQPTVTFANDNTDSWAFTFSDLPKYKRSGSTFTLIQYTVKEDLGVNGYSITTGGNGLMGTFADDSTTVTVTANGTATGEGITNTLKHGTITGLKVDTVSKTDATPVSGATIGLFDSSASTAVALATTITDEQGRYTFENVLYATNGTYYVKEITAPNNYQLSTDVITAQFDVNGATGQTIDLSSPAGEEQVEERIKDIPVYASLSIRKTDVNTTNAMDDVKFKLNGKDWMNNEVTKTGTTSNGTLTFTDIPVGTYTLTETKVTNYEAPDSFSVVVTSERNADNANDNHAVITVTNNRTQDTLTADSVTNEYSITNKLIFRDFSFTKYGTDDEVDLTSKSVLAGAEFKLYNDQACTEPALQTVFSSNEAGKVTFTNLRCGTYYIKETKEPVNFKADPKVYTVTVKQDGTVESDLTECTNEAIRGSFTMTKVDEADRSKVVPGSTYTLYKLVPRTQTVSTFANGIALQADGTDMEEIYVTEDVTDENGKITFENLLIGPTYIVRETKAPEGYQVSKNPISIEVQLTAEGANPELIDNGGGTVVMDEDGNITWLEPPTRVEIEKVDENGKLLAGAKLQLTDANGKVIDTWTTDDKAHVLEAVLVTDQKYILTELEAPSGYQIAEPVTFTVEEKTQGVGEIYTQKVTMIDKKIPPAAKSDVAKTGDTTSLTLWIALAVVALGAILVVFILRKKKDEEDSEE